MSQPWTPTPLPPYVQFARQSAMFWNSVLPGRMGAALERLEADNIIACELAQQQIRDMAARARLRIQFWPAVELGDLVHAQHKMNRKMDQLILAGFDCAAALGTTQQAMADYGAQLRKFGTGEQGAADWGG